MPGGAGADAWTFVSYALLHGSWIHLGVNIAWMVAFGTPVLRRFGTVRFLVLSLVAAMAAAVLHLATHWGEFIPMIGASGAISGQMGAAVGRQHRVWNDIDDPGPGGAGRLAGPYRRVPGRSAAVSDL
jgi:membrane associated rhomboid family serine protease